MESLHQAWVAKSIEHMTWDWKIAVSNFAFYIYNFIEIAILGLIIITKVIWLYKIAKYWEVLL